MYSLGNEKPALNTLVSSSSRTHVLHNVSHIVGEASSIYKKTLFKSVLGHINIVYTHVKSKNRTNNYLHRNE